MQLTNVEIGKMQQLIEESKAINTASWMLRDEEMRKYEKWAGKALALIKKCYPSSFERAESLYKKSHRSGGILTQDFTALVACMESILECDEFLADTSTVEVTPEALEKIKFVCNNFENFVQKSKVKINNEKDVHNLFSGLLAMHFGLSGTLNEVVMTNYRSGKFNRCDIELPDLNILIEIKYTGNRTGSKDSISKVITSELAEDLLEYSSTKTQAKHLINFIYDPTEKHAIVDRESFEKGLKREVKSETSNFNIFTYVRPKINS